MNKVCVHLPITNTLSRKGATKFSDEPRWKSSMSYNTVHAYTSQRSTLNHRYSPVWRAPTPLPDRHITPSSITLNTLRRSSSAVLPKISNQTKSSDDKINLVKHELKYVINHATSLHEVHDSLNALLQQLDAV
jgi:hypothetical protein